MTRAEYRAVYLAAVVVVQARENPAALSSALDRLGALIGGIPPQRQHDPENPRVPAAP